MSSGRSFTTTFKTKAETEGISKMQQHLKDLHKSLVENKQEQKALSKEITAAEKEIQKINKQIEKTGGATEEQKKRLEELNRTVSSGKDALESLKVKQSQLQSEINDTNKKIEEERAALEKLKQSMSDAKGHAADLVKEMGAIGAAATAAVAGIFAFTKGSAEWADELNTLSKQTGISTDELQKFAYASDIIDVSVDTITGSLTKLTRNMQSAAEGGTSAAAEAFTKLGISVTDATGHLRDRQEVFYEAIDALGKIENVTERDAIAMNIFGKSAQELNPLILGGADTLRELGDEAERAGLILDQTTLDGLNEFNDKIDLLKAKGTQIKNLAAAEMTPALDGLIEVGDELLNEIKEMAQSGELKKMAKELGGMIKSGAEALKNIISFVWKYKEAIGAAVAGMVAFKASLSILGLIKSLYTGIKELVNIIKSGETAMQALNAVMASNAIFAVISAVVALTTAVATFAATTNSSTEAVYKSYEHLDAYNAKLHELEDSFNSSMDAVAGEREILEMALGDYDALRSKTELTTAEKERLSSAIETLTGKLGLTTDEIRDQTGAYRDLSIEVENYIKNLENKAVKEYYEEQIKESAVAREKAKKSLEEANASLLSAQAKLSYLQQQYIDLHNRGSLNISKKKELEDAINQQIASIEASEKAITDARAAYNSAVADIDDAKDELNDISVAADKAAGSQDDLTSSIEECEKKLEELAKTENDLKSKSSSLRSEMNSLTSAMQQLEKGESLSLDKLLDLVEKYPEYAELLLDARDNTDLQKQALEELWTAKKNDYILTQQAALDNIDASNKVAQTEIDNIKRRIGAWYELRNVTSGIGGLLAQTLYGKEFKRLAELEAGIKENEKTAAGIRARMDVVEKLQPGDFYTTEKTTDKTTDKTGSGGEPRKGIPVPLPRNSKRNHTHQHTSMRTVKTLPSKKPMQKPKPCWVLWIAQSSLAKQR